MRNRCSFLTALCLALAMGAVWADPRTPQAATSAVPTTAADLSDPRTTWKAVMNALMQNDIAAASACFYAPDAFSARALPEYLKFRLAQHRLGQAAVARFGKDGRRLLAYPMSNPIFAFDEDMRRWSALVADQKPVYAADTATLETGFGVVAHFKKVGDGWKWVFLCDPSIYPAGLDSFLRAEQLEDDSMRELAQEIEAGAYKDVEEAKAGWSLKRHAPEWFGGGNVPTTLPTNRWSRKSEQAGLTPFQKLAYQRLALVQICKFHGGDEHGSFDILSGWTDGDNSLVDLYRMGLDVVPILAEALDDTTDSATITEDQFQVKTGWKVNQLVARLIERACDRQFALILDKEGHALQLAWDINVNPALIPHFREMVLDWYKENRGRTEAERKLADVDDPWFRNRFDGIEWLGKTRDAKAAPAIVGDIERTLKRMQTDESGEDELLICAEALEGIGDKDNLPAVKKAFDHMYDFSLGGQAGGWGYIKPSDLFDCYFALKSLGGGAREIGQMREAFAKHKNEMELGIRQQYDALLQGQP